MPKRKIGRPTLLLRTALFTDGLRAATGLDAVQIERRVRAKQYEAYGLQAPEEETVRDYFGLYRAVAFEPRQTDNHAPWLVAAELEFPGCSYRYFHPLIDLLFGQLESSAFWSAHFQKIPEAWIEAEAREGCPETANEWRAMNEALKRRRHRAKQPSVPLDKLSFLHLTMMRLPAEISGILFARKGLARSWSRAYATQPKNFAFLKKVPPIDAMAALVALTEEAAEIGDMERFVVTRKAAMEFLPQLKEDPACRRIHKQLASYVTRHLKQMVPRRYNATFHHGFGAPASWRALMAEYCLKDMVERYDPLERKEESK